jgi:4-hydroxybenzoate polyprenyltransferase/phosphoserine phosphatase
MRLWKYVTSNRNQESIGQDSCGNRQDSNYVPLCVDLDGTLIKTDTLLEILVRAIRMSLLTIFRVPFWLFQGRANLKSKLASYAGIDAQLLPYREDVLEWLRCERASGRRIVLVTAADISVARAVAAHLNLFDDVMGSGEHTNLKGEAKLRAMQNRFGAEFDYAGDAAADLKIWPHCRDSIVVHARAPVLRAAQRHSHVVKVFPRLPITFRVIRRQLRIHQWSKNLLVLVPAIAAHRIFEYDIFLQCIALFAAFSLWASFIYILNDILDLENDRQHHSKKSRPLASGDLGILPAILAASGLFIGSILIAWTFVPSAIPALSLYLAVNWAYSSYFKRVPLMDAFCLSGLYVLRLIAGHSVGPIAYSPWLLSFAMFIFLSLAWCKRVSELTNLQVNAVQQPIGRGYRVTDLPLVTTLGICSGFSSGILFALYTASPHIMNLYPEPGFLLMFMPLFLGWLSRVWLIACRGEMDEDPVMFAVKDRFSYFVVAAGIVLLFLARYGWIHLSMVR